MNVKERRVLLCGYWFKKKKSRLEIQLLRAFKDMTFLRSRWFKISNTGSWRQIYVGNCRVITPTRIIDGSNKTTALGLRHGTKGRSWIIFHIQASKCQDSKRAFTISLLIYPKMGWVRRFIRMNWRVWKYCSHFFSEIDRTSSLVHNPTYPDRFQILRNSVYTGRFEL